MCGLRHPDKTERIYLAWRLTLDPDLARCQLARQGPRRQAIDELDPGQEIVPDYRGDNERAPRITLHRSLTGVVTASDEPGLPQLPDLTSGGQQTSTDSDTRRLLVFPLLTHLRGRRGTQHVVLVQPQ